MIDTIEYNGKYWQGKVDVLYRHYEGGHEDAPKCIRFIDSETHEPIGTATINMPQIEATVQELADAGGVNRNSLVWIKDYAENEGVLKSMRDAGMILHEWANVPLNSHGTTAPLVELTPMALEGWK
jgi:hypothetical protein